MRRAYSSSLNSFSRKFRKHHNPPITPQADIHSQYYDIPNNFRFLYRIARFQRRQTLVHIKKNSPPVKFIWLIGRPLIIRSIAMSIGAIPIAIFRFPFSAIIYTSVISIITTSKISAKIISTLVIVLLPFGLFPSMIIGICVAPSS